MHTDPRYTAGGFTLMVGVNDNTPDEVAAALAMFGKDRLCVINRSSARGKFDGKFVVVRADTILKWADALRADLAALDNA